MARLRILVLLALLSGGWPALAQPTELARERASLDGVDGFFLSVNIEGPRSLLDRDALDLFRMEETFRAQLREAGLTVYDDAGVAAADRAPYLYVHVNTMDAGPGLVPFAVEAAFFQRVILARDPARRMVAETWSTGVVGIVSYDNLPLIGEAAADLVDDFAEDLRRANP